MKAVWLDNGSLSVRDDLPIPVPASGEALIRTRVAGLCGTDLELQRGYLPFNGVPGHEFVGEVVESPSREWLGRRVVGEINTSCGACEACRRGLRTHCEARSVLGLRYRNGVMAECFCLPETNLHVVPDRVPDEAAVFAEPLAAALQIQKQVRVGPETRVLVVGAGRLGQLIARSLALTGCDLQVLVRHPIPTRLLAKHRIKTVTSQQLRDQVFDLVVEATGTPDGFSLAAGAVRPRGTLLLKSTFRGNTPIDLSGLVVDEITMIGSRCGSMAAALRLLDSGHLDPTDLIDAEYPLSDAVDAFDRAAAPGTLKVLIRPDGSAGGA